jgi:short-subunit dehydrogenase
MSYLIVGASSGLGRELAYIFAENKKDLILLARDDRDLSSIKSDLQERFDVKIDTISLDFSQIDEIQKKLFSQINLDYLEGVLFPVGLMFEEDYSNSDINTLKKIVFTNFLSICFTSSQFIKLYKNKKFLIVGFGSVSGILGRKINTSYAASKRALESFFESLFFDNINSQIKVHFYTLGYLNTNLAFGKKLKLPKADVKPLANLVFKNKDYKFIKRHFPYYWSIVSLFLKIIPIKILLKFSSLLK